MTINERHVIAVGEPGCYVYPGHIDGTELESAVIYLFDVDLDHLERARHSWMVVTNEDDGPPVTFDPATEQWFREVLPGTPGALPFTIVAVEGEWERP